MLETGVLIYTWYAELCHLPSNLIVASPMPCCAAVVAAPALKLWPPNCCGSSPIICSAFRNSTTNIC